MSHTDGLLALSTVELRRRIGTKEISPVELLEASIARIEALNPAVNAIAATDFERARKEAKVAEAAALRGEPLGPLHGLPTGIKDLHETEGLLTTYGSPLHRGFVPERDAAMVALVRKAGAIVVAKTNVPEFGAGANTRNPVWGATGNPFDPRLNAGGSSGGAGGRARLRHAAGVHRLRHRRLAAHTGRDLRRGRLPAVARHGADGHARARLDADLGARPDGPQRRRHAAPVLRPGRHGRPRSARLPARSGRDRDGPAGRPRPPARRLDRGFRAMPGEQRVPLDHARADGRRAATCSARATKSRSTSARPTAASTSSARRASRPATRLCTTRIRTRSAPTCAPTTR